MAILTKMMKIEKSGHFTAFYGLIKFAAAADNTHLHNGSSINAGIRQCNEM